MIQGWRNYLGLLSNLPISSFLSLWTQDKASTSLLSDWIPFPCRQGFWKAHSCICHFSGMMSRQLFTPWCQACHLTPLLCLGSSVWWTAPQTAPAFLLALPAILTPAPRSHPSCLWDQLQMPLLVFCTPQRGGCNYTTLPSCLGACWRYGLRHA